MLSKALRDLALDDLALGEIIADRFLPSCAPTLDDLPCVTWSQTGGARRVSQTTSTGLVDGQVRCRCWAEGYTEARKLADALRAALHYKTDGDEILRLVLEDEDEEIEVPLSGALVGTVCISLQFRLWFREI